MTMPSTTSSDHGAPFADIFARVNGDFYKIDGALFSPAEAIVTSVRSGATYRGGRLEPTLVETDAHGLVSEVLRHTGGASLVVLLTGLDAAPLEQGLLPVLPALTARHRVLVAGVSDPRIAEMARARGDADAVYDAVAAERGAARLQVAQLGAVFGGAVELERQTVGVGNRQRGWA